MENLLAVGLGIVVAIGVVMETSLGWMFGLASGAIITTAMLVAARRS